MCGLFLTFNDASSLPQSQIPQVKIRDGVKPGRREASKLRLGWVPPPSPSTTQPGVNHCDCGVYIPTVLRCAALVSDLVAVFRLAVTPWMVKESHLLTHAQHKYWVSQRRHTTHVVWLLSEEIWGKSLVFKEIFGFNVSFSAAALSFVLSLSWKIIFRFFLFVVFNKGKLL